MELGSKCNHVEAVEDIHICGACRTQFSNIDVFLHHKQQQCSVLLALCGENQTPQVGRPQHTETSVSNATTDSKLQSDDEQMHVPTAGKDVIQQPQGHDYIHTHQDAADRSQLPADYTNRLAELDVKQNTRYVQITHAHMEQSIPRENQPMDTGNQQQYVVQPNVRPMGDYSTTHEPIELQHDMPAETIYTLESITHPEPPQITPMINFKAMAQNGDVSSANQLPFYAPSLVHAGSYYANHTNQSSAGSVSMPDYHVLHPGNTVGSETIETVQSDVQVQDEYVTSTDGMGQQVNYTLHSDETEISPPKTNKFSHVNSVVPNICCSSKRSKRERKTDKERDGSIEQSTDGSLVLHYSKNGHNIVLNVCQSDSKTCKKSTADSVIQSTVDTTTSKPPLEKRFQCPECEYRSFYSKDLERHVRIHSGERPYTCDECGKSFTRNDKLLLHLRYHAGEKAFKCQLCNYKAVENGSLRKHMRIHTDSRPYKFVFY